MVARAPGWRRYIYTQEAKTGESWCLVSLLFSTPGPYPTKWFCPHSGKLLPPQLNLRRNAPLTQVCLLGDSKADQVESKD